MNAVLVAAIRDKRQLRFIYNGKLRLVEPQCDGIGRKGTELLRVHQLEGGPQREPLFEVAKLDRLDILDETFVEPGPNDRRDHSTMATIPAQL